MGALAHLADHWDEDRRQYGNDGNDCEQFDEGKCGVAGARLHGVIFRFISLLCNYNLYVSGTQGCFSC